MNILSLELFDRCPRRYFYEQQWEAKFISPISLLHVALDAALLSDDPEQAAKDVTFSLAQTKDIDSPANRFMLVRHTGYLAGILGVALKGKDLVFPVPYINEDTFRTLAHSWKVLGELITRKAPVKVTAVAIGSSKEGRRYSAWTRGFTHPQSRQLRFRKRDGTTFTGWNPVWRDETRIATEDWLKQMKADGVLEELVQTRTLSYNPSDQRLIRAAKDSQYIEQHLPTTEADAPMRRAACDDILKGACGFQSCCWSPTPASPEQFPHLFQIRLKSRAQDTLREEPEAHTSRADSASSLRPWRDVHIMPNPHHAGN